MLVCGCFYHLAKRERNREMRKWKRERKREDCDMDTENRSFFLNSYDEKYTAERGFRGLTIDPSASSSSFRTAYNIIRDNYRHIHA